MKTLCYLFLLFSISIYSQKTIKDATSQETISHVEIYSNEGDLIGTSDINGIISTDITNSINNSKTQGITFSHPLYEKKELTVQEFTSTETFLLNPAAYIQLKDVVVYPKKNFKYMKLTGYFRSVQIDNDRPDYVMEGMVEYYISLKSQKIDMQITAFRSFTNVNIKSLKEEQATYMYVKGAGCPALKEMLAYKNLANKYDVDSIKNIVSAKKSKRVVGHIAKYKDLSTLEMDIITPANQEKMSLFGAEFIFNSYSRSSYYNCKNPNEIDLENILYLKENAEFRMKAKKDAPYDKVDTSHELYITGVEYVDKKAKGLTSASYKFKSPSNYKENFWEKVDNSIYQPFPKILETYIKENMVEVKNK